MRHGIQKAQVTHVSEFPEVEEREMRLLQSRWKTRRPATLHQADDKSNTRAELQQNYRKPRMRRVHPEPAGADFSIFFGCTSILPRPHLLPRLWSLPTGCPLSTLHCYTAQNLGFTGLLCRAAQKGHYP